MNMRFASLAVVCLLASTAIAQITLPPWGSTFTGTAATRGFWFVAPTTFVITGLRVPNEANQPFQAVEVLDLGTSPPPSYSATTLGTQLFYDNTTPSGIVIPCSIVVPAGQVIGVLGLCTSVQGGGTGYNSYGTPAGPFASTILGNPVTLTRFGTQFNIATGGNRPVWQEPAGALSRIEVSVAPATGLFANFTSNVVGGATPLTVNFSDATYTSDPGGVTSWSWDLDGDNVPDSNLRNPTFVYAACGDYTVSLTVTDATFPPSTITRTAYIRAGDNAVPDFTSTVLGPGVVQFTDATTPAATSWAWDLDGDGNTDSTLQHPVWAYTSACIGVNVRLTVMRDCRGPFTVTKPTAIVPNTLQTTAAGGVGSSSTTIVGNMFDVQVTNPSGINICALSVRPYTFVGPFTVSLYATPDTYVGKHITPSAWRLIGTGAGQSTGGVLAASVVTVVPMAGFSYLPAGNYGLAVLLQNPAGTEYVVSTTGPQGPFANADLTLFPNPTTAPGRAVTSLFTAAGTDNRVWNGALHYSTIGNGGDAGYGFFGAGCAGTLGMTNLTGNRPQLGATMTVSLNNLPQSMAIMMTGFSRTASVFGPLPVNLAALGAPGCFGRVSTDATVFVIGAANVATWSFGVPIAPGLLGVQMHTQALVFDAGRNALGAVVSDAASLLIGN